MEPASPLTVISSPGARVQAMSALKMPPNCTDASRASPSAITVGLAKRRRRLGGGVVLLGLLLGCTATFATWRAQERNETSYIARANQEWVNCPRFELSPLQWIHPGAQIHKLLQARDCLNEQREQKRRGTLEQRADDGCPSQAIGLLQKFHAGAQVHAILNRQACLQASRVGL